MIPYKVHRNEQKSLMVRDWSKVHQLMIPNIYINKVAAHKHQVSRSIIATVTIKYLDRTNEFEV